MRNQRLSIATMGNGSAKRNVFVTRVSLD